MFKLTRTSFYYLHKHTLFNGDLNFWSAATYCVDFFCFGLCRLTGEKKKFIDKNLKTIPSFSSFCSAVYSMITTITLPVTSSPQFHKWMGNDRNVKTTAHNLNIGNLFLCPPLFFHTLTFHLTLISRCPSPPLSFSLVPLSPSFSLFRALTIGCHPLLSQISSVPRISEDDTLISTPRSVRNGVMAMVRRERTTCESDSVSFSSNRSYE